MNHETQVWSHTYAAAINYGDTNIVAKAKADQAVNDFLTSLGNDFKVEKP
jgi:hypothetical protein